LNSKTGDAEHSLLANTNDLRAEKSELHGKVAFSVLKIIRAGFIMTLALRPFSVFCAARLLTHLAAANSGKKSAVSC